MCKVSVLVVTVSRDSDYYNGIAQVKEKTIMSLIKQNVFNGNMKSMASESDFLQLKLFTLGS